MRGEKIYEYDLDVTGMTDYGVSLDAILYLRMRADGRIDLDIRAVVET